MPYFQPFVSALQFVSGGQTQTVAQLLSNYPAGVSYVGMYARVSDLWGAVDEVMRCCTNGSGVYYWRPQRTDYSTNSSQSSGSVTLTPLVSPPSIFMTATLLGNLTVTPSTTNAWPGCRFEIVSPSSLGIYSVSFSGLVGGIVSNLLAGNTRVLEYTVDGWKGK